jgi:hypothetical protein
MSTAGPARPPIVRAAIHPAIGVARVGNSEKEFFIGPEVVYPAPEPPGFYRDGAGALKRQAAQFRIYGYDAAGNVVGELTAADAGIRWTVHVANRKAAWYEWQIALDIPEAAGTALPPRNPDVTGDDRAGLVIDGGAHSITGCSSSGPVFEGSFQGTPVTLGELRTDEAGRLIFLGGHGISASPTGQPIYDPDNDNSFINANGWYDDTSDGPVTAEVMIDGTSIPVDPAWVLTAPPNYAPGVLGVRTLYDLLLDVCLPGQRATNPSFRDDVYPILQRLSGLQWVNQGFSAQFGPRAPYDFQDPAFVARLARDPKQGGVDLYAELRRQVLNSFRPPQPLDGNQLPWPWIYGDGMQVPADQSPQQNASVSQSQYDVLSAWAAGAFVADWGTEAPVPHTLDEVPLAEQPAMLDRAALEHCLADAFHPGCEVTWPMRHASLFRAPFRVRARPEGEQEPDYGPVLTPTIALGLGGPLNAQGPGDLTRWMGLPWQADTAFCRSGYDRKYDPFIPTFWPARVPNQVLTADQYGVVMDPKASDDARLAAFDLRRSWVRALPKDTSAAMMEMVKIYGSMGLLELLPGPDGVPGIPPEMLVESVGPDYPTPKKKLLHAELDVSAEMDVEAEAEDAEHWPRPVRRGKQR